MTDVAARRPIPLAIRVAIPLLVIAALPGCTRSHPDAIAAVNRARPNDPTAGLPITESTATVPVHRGGKHPRATAWADAAVTADGRALIVRFESRGAGCDWLDHVDTDESAKRVRITVYLALNPTFDNVGTDGPLTVCGTAARYEATRVPLARPLSGRSVFDASSGDVARPVARASHG